MNHGSTIVGLILLMTGFSSVHIGAAEPLDTAFRDPPDAAKPHTWWHWMNGHIEREAITRELEEMKATGLGGFTVFNTSEGTPPGPVPFMSDDWMELMRHTMTEASRLGLEMGVMNGAGWSSSGGPWIPPDHAMTEVAWTETAVMGPADIDQTLETPEPVLGLSRDMAKDPVINKRYYVDPSLVAGHFRDIVCFAIPSPAGGGTSFRLSDWQLKAGFGRNLTTLAPDSRAAPAEAVVDPDALIDLSSKLDEAGRLRWSAPAGEWTILRMGYQPTGRKNHPAAAGGEGLECDKLTPAGADLHWKHAVAPLIRAAGTPPDRSLTTVLIDSYEVGHQNWSRTLAADFRERRGYDLIRFLPALTGRIVRDIGTTERFLWDFRRTLADLIAENYFGRFAQLCKAEGLAFAAEAYGTYGNMDDFAAMVHAHVPMTEWWAFQRSPRHQATARLAASAAHLAGLAVVDSEAFTGQPGRIFEEHPYALKAQGDYYFCQGVTRYSFHTFPHNPYPVRPGLGLGSYGTRIDPGTTWWPMAGAWMSYIARCQHMLRQGTFSADLLYYAGEDAPLTAKAREALVPPPPAGHDFDICGRETIDRLKVRGDRLTLPSGMSYRILVLPDTGVMRPDTLHRIERLAAAGAVVVGPKPTRAPGLDLDDSEEDMIALADRMWGECDGQSTTMATHGKGRIYWNRPLADIFRELGLTPDFEFSADGDAPSGDTLFPGTGVEFIHRTTKDTDIYFVSNQHHEPKTLTARFRVSNRMPEIWHPDSGAIEPAARVQATDDGRTAVTLDLDPAGSVFVVFRSAPDGMGGITRIESGEAAARAVIRRDGTRWFARSRAAGPVTLTTSHGDRRTASIPEMPEPIELRGPWTVAFPGGMGAPERVEMPYLMCWTQHPHEEVRYFSGIATYGIDVDVPAGYFGDGRRLMLDLGDVQVIARTRVNDTDLGVQWKAPFAIDATAALRPGRNRIEIAVANLWVNRLVGDRRHPDDCDWTDKTGSRSKGQSLPEIPDWAIRGAPRPSPERRAFVSWRWPHLDKKEPMPAGLHGPVRLIPEAEAEAK